MFGHGSFVRQVLPAVDAFLAVGERRRAASVLRGLGRGPDVGRVVDWVLVATDRRVLLFSLPPGAAPTPTLVNSYPCDEVLVIDAQLSGTTPTLVVRFPGAVIAWFHPPAAWRAETAQLVAELGRVVPYPDDADGAGERTPADESRP